MIIIISLTEGLMCGINRQYMGDLKKCRLIIMSRTDTKPKKIAKNCDISVPERHFSRNVTHDCRDTSGSPHMERFIYTSTIAAVCKFVFTLPSSRFDKNLPVRSQFYSYHHQNRRLSSHSYSHESVIFFVFFGSIF